MNKKRSQDPKNPLKSGSLEEKKIMALIQDFKHSPVHKYYVQRKPEFYIQLIKIYIHLFYHIV